MATTKLFFNLTTSRWVRSAGNPEPIEFPRFSYGDVASIDVQFVEQKNDGDPSKVQVVTSLVAVQFAVGNFGASPATSATAGSPTNNIYPITVPFDPAGVGSLVVGNAPTIIPCEWKLTDTVGPKRWHSRVYIEPQLYSSTVADPPAGQRAISSDEAAGIYVPKQWPAGLSMLVTSPNGTQWSVYPGDDGQFHFDPV